MKAEKFMSYAILVVGFGYLFLLTFIPIPESGQKYADVILGFIIGTALTTIIQYWWGSSSGSASKSKVIEDLTKPPEQPK